jgi:hypothetical protein
MDSGTKKALYGVIFLLLAGAIVYAIVRPFFEVAPSCFDGVKNQDEEDVDCGGTCEACDVLSLEPLRVSREPKVFSIGAITPEVSAEVTNPNAQFSARFPYAIEFYNADGQKIQTLEGTASVAPGGKTRLIKSGVTVAQNLVGEIKVVIGEPAWEKSFSALRPDVALSGGIATELTERGIRVSGTLKNEGGGPVSSVRVVASLFDAFGKELFVAETTLSGMKTAGERDFIVAFPSDAALESAFDAKKSNVWIEAE